MPRKPPAEWRNRIVGYGVEEADQLLANPANWRIHPKYQQDALSGVLDEVGWVQNIIVNKTTGHVVDGHMRAAVAISKGAQVPVTYVELTEDEERLILATLDPIGTLAVTDNVKLTELIRELDGQATPVADDVQGVLDALQDTEPAPYLGDVVPLDVVYPTDNEYDIPALDLKMQATEAPLPWFLFGSGRFQRPPGTVYFYTDDARFERIWTSPQHVLKTNAVAAVEPNFSVYVTTPKALALWNTYRKRWVARWWQAHGIRILVDLYVSHEYADVNLLGVPKGWRAFATRGLSDADYLDTHYETACAVAGSDDVLFVVYGGSRAVKATCKARGWAWIPEFMGYKGRKPAPMGDE